MTELYSYEAAPEAPSLLEADLFDCMIDRPANLPDYYLHGPGVWIAGADMLLAAGHVPGGARPHGWHQFCRGAYTKPSRDGHYTMRVRQHGKFWIIERSGEVDVDGVGYRGIEALVFNFQARLAPMPIWTHTCPAAMRLAEFCEPVPPARVKGIWIEAGLYDLNTGRLVTLPATTPPSTVSR
jgi:hypothetical protein